MKYTLTFLLSFIAAFSGYSQPNTNYIGRVESAYTRTLKTNESQGSWQNALGIWKVAGATNVVHLAVRTDGRAGSGSMGDPLDASTDAKLTAIFSNGVANTEFVFAPGTYLYGGGLGQSPGVTNAVNRGTLPNNAVIRGAGIGLTTIKMTGQTNYNSAWIGGANSAYTVLFYGLDPASTYRISDMTIDMDMANNGGTNWTGSAVNFIGGTNSSIERIHVINAGGRVGGHPAGYSEAFPLYTTSTYGVIKDCIVDRLYSGAVNCILANGYGSLMADNFVDISNPQVDNGGNRNAFGFFGGYVKIVGNTIKTGSSGNGVYADTGSTTNSMIANNNIEIGTSGVGVYLIPSSGNLMSGLLIAENQFTLSGSGSRSAVTFAGGGGFIRDSVISGNTFSLGSSTNEANDVMIYLNAATNISILNNVSGPTNTYLELVAGGTHTFFNNKHLDGTSWQPRGASLRAITNTLAGNWRITNASQFSTNGNVLKHDADGNIYSATSTGSESTAPGTNLVMVGTTLSLSNTIINDAAKWRSNSSYLGGALTAGEAVSWSSNGTWHLTFPHGTALTVGSNGVILTNGTAIAGGGGSESTAVGTNLVMVGTTISLSNPLVSIVATNSTLVGTTHFAGPGNTGRMSFSDGPTVVGLRGPTAGSGQTNIGWNVSINSDALAHPYQSNTYYITSVGTGGYPNGIGLQLGTNAALSPTDIAQRPTLGVESLPWYALYLSNSAAGGPIIYTNGVAVPLHLIGTGSGSQTPWTSDINGAGYSLTNVGNTHTNNSPLEITNIAFSTNWGINMVLATNATRLARFGTAETAGGGQKGIELSVGNDGAAQLVTIQMTDKTGYGVRVVGNAANVANEFGIQTQNGTAMAGFGSASAGFPETLKIGGALAKISPSSFSGDVHLVAAPNNLYITNGTTGAAVAMNIAGSLVVTNHVTVGGNQTNSGRFIVSDPDSLGVITTYETLKNGFIGTRIRPYHGAQVIRVTSVYQEPLLDVVSADTTDNSTIPLLTVRNNNREAIKVFSDGNTVAAGTITATNGYIKPISVLPNTNEVLINFAATNEWQSITLSTNVIFKLTNMAAGVSRQLRIEMPISPAATNSVSWTNAFNNATTLPVAITNGNVYVIAFDSWGTTTNEVTGAGRFFR